MKKEVVKTILKKVIESNPKAFDFDSEYYTEKYNRENFIFMNLDNHGGVINYMVMFYDDIDKIRVEFCENTKGEQFYKCVYFCGDNSYVHYVDKK